MERRKEFSFFKVRYSLFLEPIVQQLLLGYDGRTFEFLMRVFNCDLGRISTDYQNGPDHLNLLDASQLATFIKTKRIPYSRDGLDRHYTVDSSFEFNDESRVQVESGARALGLLRWVTLPRSFSLWLIFGQEGKCMRRAFVMFEECQDVSKWIAYANLPNHHLHLFLWMKQNLVILKVNTREEVQRKKYFVEVVAIFVFHHGQVHDGARFHAGCQSGIAELCLSNLDMDGYGRAEAFLKQTFKDDSTTYFKYPLQSGAMSHLGEEVSIVSLGVAQNGRLLAYTEGNDATKTYVHALNLQMNLAADRSRKYVIPIEKSGVVFTQRFIPQASQQEEKDILDAITDAIDEHAKLLDPPPANHGREKSSVTSSSSSSVGTKRKAADVIDLTE